MKNLNHYLDEETVLPKELLPEEHWGNNRSEDEIEKNMCKATKDAHAHERLAGDNESVFLHTTKAHRPIPLKEHTVPLNIARKKHPQRRSKKNLDGLYEVLAPRSVMQKTDQYTSVIREPGKLEVTVRNSDIAKIGTRDERKTQLMDYVNRRGPRVHQKTTEAKILSHTNEFTQNQKGYRKMKHRKRDTGTGVSSNKSNITRAMQVQMPKVPANLVPPETTSQPEINPDQQNITSEVIIASPPSGQRTELIIPYTSAPVEAMRQVLPTTTKRTRNSSKYYGYDIDDSSGESSNSCPPNFVQPLKKRCAVEVASVRPSVIETIVDTATRVEPNPNPFPSPVIGEVSPTDPRIRPADQRSPDERILDEEDM